MKFNEIRLRKGDEDDIVINGVSIHLENMTGHIWWLGVYVGKRRNTFWISSKSKIKVRLEENGLKSKIIEQEK